MLTMRCVLTVVTPAPIMTHAREQVLWMGLAACLAFVLMVAIARTLAFIWGEPCVEASYLYYMLG